MATSKSGQRSSGQTPDQKADQANPRATEQDSRQPSNSSQDNVGQSPDAPASVTGQPAGGARQRASRASTPTAAAPERPASRKSGAQKGSAKTEAKTATKTAAKSATKSARRSTGAATSPDELAASPSAEAAASSSTSSSTSAAEPPRQAAASRLYGVVVECVTPSLDDGRFPIKRVAGDGVKVEADVYKEGHDLLAARVVYRGPGDEAWHAAPLIHNYNTDRWVGGFQVSRPGRWKYSVEAWTDLFASWQSGFEKKLTAGQDVSSELLEGAQYVEQAAADAGEGEARATLERAAALLRDDSADPGARVGTALAPELRALVAAHWKPRDLTRYDRELEIQVDRERARFAAWYEFFPRSCTDDPNRHGTFADAERFLPRVAQLGFDVVYLPPIHPIGVANRKGKNNALTAGPGDPGSPWAIGGEAGGHDAVHPELGTIEDFDRFVARAQSLGLEVALDYALQCSPDHPWLKEHPEWFFIRPDGTLKYAENPPKKYQDIYPINFWCDDREALWAACRDVLFYWIGHGVRTFRVDNPHTKPLAFWEWVIGEVLARHPDVIFFAEAFTRPKRMKYLAKIGFTMSYTYFTWKNTPYEIRQWLSEFAETGDYYRGNLFANTPDILTDYLVHGGRNAFRIRLLLAATLSPLYGIYAGYELCENVQRPGSEEYIDNEKYELKPRNFNAPGNLNGELVRINSIRRQQEALRKLRNLRLGASENDSILCYVRTSRQADLIVVVNCDPHRPQAGWVHVPLDVLGLRPDQPYVVEDLLTGAHYTWRGSRNYVHLDPNHEPGHVLAVHRPHGWWMEREYVE